MAAPAHVQIQSQEIICDQTLHHQTGTVGLRGHRGQAGAALGGEVVSGKPLGWSQVWRGEVRSAGEKEQWARAVCDRNVKASPG